MWSLLLVLSQSLLLSLQDLLLLRDIILYLNARSLLDIIIVSREISSVQGNFQLPGLSAVSHLGRIVSAGSDSIILMRIPLIMLNQDRDP